MINKKLTLHFSAERRRILQKSVIASGILAAESGLWGGTVFGNSHQLSNQKIPVSNIPNLAGTLHKTTVENDPSTTLIIPRGFSVREIARTGQPAKPNSTYLWHSVPDGGATFPTNDGGWIYVSNSERNRNRGGVGALRFTAQGVLIDSYSIAKDTSTNCAGGPTPWGTWLSCEETSTGLVYECDPLGKQQATPPPLWVLSHTKPLRWIQSTGIFI